VGGLDTFIIDLLNNWPDRNDELVLICNSSHTAVNLYKKRLVNSNASLVVHDLPMVPEKQAKFIARFGIGLWYKLYSFVIQYSLFVYYLLVSYRILNLKKYDKLMIINGGYPAGPSCRAISIVWGIYKGRKSIHNFHNYAVPPKKIVSILENLIDYFVCKYTYCFVSVSKTCSESIRIRPSISTFTDIIYIYNGINDQVVIPKSRIINELGLKENTLICLMLATYEMRKGHKFLFKAFKKVSTDYPDSVLICCGCGTLSDIKRTNQLVFDLGLENKIHILDYRDDAMELLAQADILLISSQEFESFGLTAIEAMKYKKPIVSTNVGGLSEVIKDNEGGYLFDANDVDGYANKIIELFKDPSLRFDQGELGYKRYIKNFQVKRVAQEYCNLIYNL